MGSDIQQRTPCFVAGVSIHAPVWGATVSVSVWFLYIGVSIHAPVWGATGIKRVARLYTISFNPRSRMGSDCRMQSIFCPHTCFNPRSRMGSDVSTPSAEAKSTVVSIHAPVWGATKSRRRRTRASKSFNPRSRMGSDSHALYISG